MSKDLKMARNMMKLMDRYVQKHYPEEMEIHNQLREDLEYNQMTRKEYISPFTDRPRKRNRGRGHLSSDGFPIRSRSSGDETLRKSQKRLSVEVFLIVFAFRMSNPILRKIICTMILPQNGYEDYAYNHFCQIKLCR